MRLVGLPQGAHRGHVEVVYRGPHDAAPRIVAIASPIFGGSAGDGWLQFEVPRLGTYQAVVSESAPTRRTREFTFRGILGFSMGGSGSDDLYTCRNEDGTTAPYDPDQPVVHRGCYPRGYGSVVNGGTYTAEYNVLSANVRYHFE